MATRQDKKYPVGDAIFPFGKKHKGKRIDSIPLMYLDWALTSVSIEYYPDFHAQLVEYLSNPAIQEDLEREIEDSDSEKEWSSDGDSD